MAQSLKDTKSVNVSIVKADGNTRTIAGTFATSGGNITGLPTGHKIEIGDRIALSYDVVATQIETGLVGASDVSTLETGTGLLRIDKALSQFGTLGAVQAAFTSGMLISFQSGILAGGTCYVKYSSGLMGTAADGSVIGDTGYWLVAFDTTTTTGFPSLTAMTFPPPVDGTDYSTISPSISIYQGVDATVNLTGLVVSALPSATSVTIQGGIINIASFTDVAVTKHSRFNSPVIATEIETPSLKVAGLPIEGNVVTVPYADPISQLTMLWKGYDNTDTPIANTKPDLNEITVTDPFNVGVDINIIQMDTHPIDKTIGVLLYQNLSDSKIYVRAFKYTYEGGFNISFTPFEIVGADSTDIRMCFSVVQLQNFTLEIENSALLFVFGGKATPGSAIYAGAMSINTTTLDISSTGLFAWGDTGLTTTNGDFVSLFKVVDLHPVKFTTEIERIVVVVYTGRLARFTYNLGTDTFAKTYDATTSYAEYHYDYFGNTGTDILVVTRDQKVTVNSGGDATPYSIPRNNFARYRSPFLSSDRGNLTLYDVERWEGVGGVTLNVSSFGSDPITWQRTNSNFESIPQNFQNTTGRTLNRVFELGNDLLLFYKSFGFYVMVKKSTGALVHVDRAVDSDEIDKDYLAITMLNGDTILYYSNQDSGWKANKFLADGPHLAYKAVNGEAYLAAPGSRITTSYSLEKGKTYYYSYHEGVAALIGKVLPFYAMAPKKVGVALDTNTFLYRPELNPATTHEIATSIPLNLGQSITGGTANRVLFGDSSNTVQQSNSLVYNNAQGRLAVNAGTTPEFSIQTYGAVVSGIPYTLTASGTINDGVSGDSNAILVSHNTPATLTGLVNGFSVTTGLRVVYLTNSSVTYPLTIKHQDSGSLAANRITTLTGTDYSLRPLATCILLGDANGWTILAPDITSNQIIFDSSLTEPFDNVCTTWDQVAAILNHLNTKRETFIEIIIMQSGAVSVGDGSSLYNLSRCKLRNGKGEQTILSFANGNTIDMPYELENVSIRNNTTSGYFAIATNFGLTLKGSSLIQTSACTTWALLSVSHAYTVEDYGGSGSGNGIVKESGAVEPFYAAGNTITYNLYERAGISDNVFNANGVVINYYSTTASRVYRTTQTNATSLTHNRRVPLAAPITVSGTGTTAVDLKYGEAFTVTPTGNITLNLSNPLSGVTYAFLMKQGATPYTIGFTQTIKWKGGTAFTATNSANAIDIVTLYYDGTDYYGNFGTDYQ